MRWNSDFSWSILVRKVGTESSKTYQEKLDNGFFTKYMSGHGAEMGYAGYTPGVVTILEDCDGYDTSTPGYDGLHIPVADGHYDWLYSSHCLEHIENWPATLKEWFRVVRPGGHIITVVPHRDLYEKKMGLPSRWNGDHKRFYTPASLLAEFESALPINSFRIRHLRDNDAGHIYTDGPDVHGRGQYDIELVIEKL